MLHGFPLASRTGIKICSGSTDDVIFPGKNLKQIIHDVLLHRSRAEFTRVRDFATHALDAAAVEAGRLEFAPRSRP
jgi:hypothetical protein